MDQVPCQMRVNLGICEVCLLISLLPDWKKKWQVRYNYYLAIFLSNSIVTGMPYLPAKDELVSLNRLSSKGFWKWYNSKVFDRRLYGVEQHFTFCRFSRKRKFFGNFDCDFRKRFTKGFFSDWIWRISKFPFWRKILDIYRQPLLIVQFSRAVLMTGMQIFNSCRQKFLNCPRTVSKEFSDLAEN